MKNNLIPASFLSTFLGWVVGFITIGISQGNQFNDRDFLFIYTGIFVLVSWVLFVVPIILYSQRVRKLLSNLRYSWLIGIFLGFIPCGILLIFFTQSLKILILVSWIPVIIGFISGITLPIIQKRVKWYFCYIIPIIFLLSWLYIIWPLTMKYLPKLAYPFGSGSEQAIMMHNYYQQIEVGMNLEDLNKISPKEIKPFDSATISYGNNRFRIIMKNGIVTNITK